MKKSSRLGPAQTAYISPDVRCMKIIMNRILCVSPLEDTETDDGGTLW